MKKGKWLAFIVFFIACIGIICCVLISKWKFHIKPEEKFKDLEFRQYSTRLVENSKSGLVVYDSRYINSQYYFILAPWMLIDVKGNIIKDFTKPPPLPFGNTPSFLNINLMSSQYGTRRYFSCRDENGKLAWERKDIFMHHDFCLTPQNTLLALTKEVKTYQGRLVEWDVIIEISCDGKIVSRWSTYDHFSELRKLHEKTDLDQSSSVQIPISLSIKNDGFPAEYDYYHMNSIQFLPLNKSGNIDKRFQCGNILVCFAFVDFVAIFESKTYKIVWMWGIGELQQPHMPRMLENGNILIFDNGIERKYSRVLEVNPITNSIVWEYKGSPPESFFSPELGSAERLSNGNTLIADSCNGRAFEVTTDGTIVWEWYYPEINAEGKRRKIYRIAAKTEREVKNMLQPF